MFDRVYRYGSVRRDKAAKLSLEFTLIHPIYSHEVESKKASQTPPKQIPQVDTQTSVTESEQMLIIFIKTSVSGLVVKSIVAIDGPRVRFAADAWH